MSHDLWLCRSLLWSSVWREKAFSNLTSKIPVAATLELMSLSFHNLGYHLIDHNNPRYRPLPWLLWKQYTWLCAPSNLIFDRLCKLNKLVHSFLGVCISLLWMRS